MPFDSVITSNDLSMDRVLGTGLPVALVFFEHELPADLLQVMDDLARREAGKALVIKLALRDAPQAMRRLGVSTLPAVVTVRNGSAVSSQGAITPDDLKAHAAYLLGRGPKPATRVSRPVQQPRQAAGQPVAVHETDFDREVLRSKRPVLVDFWAPWCGPCRMVAPTLDALAREHGSVLKIAKVNVDENPGLAARYGAMSIPTMIVVKDGREVDRWVGALPEHALRSRVSRWIQPEPEAA